MCGDWRPALAGAEAAFRRRGHPDPGLFHMRLVALTTVAWLLVLLTTGLVFAQRAPAPASVTPPRPDKANDVVIELFYRSDSPQSQAAELCLRRFAKQHRGICVKAYNMLQDPFQLKRLWQLSKRFRYEQASVPTFYLCDTLKLGHTSNRATAEQIKQLLTIKAYVRQGCRHCEAAQRFLNKLVERWPALKVEYRDVMLDPYVRTEVQKLAAHHQVRVVSFPCIPGCWPSGSRVPVGRNHGQEDRGVFPRSFGSLTSPTPGTRTSAEAQPQRTGQTIDATQQRKGTP